MVQLVRVFLDYMFIRFIFNDKWRFWIRSCVFVGNLVVLINGFLNQEIKVQRGLKQGDPLTLFLFILLEEGLNGLVKRDSNLSLL